VMKQHVGPGDPIRLILEENVGPVTVEVARRNGGSTATSNRIVRRWHYNRDNNELVELSVLR